MTLAIGIVSWTGTARLTRAEFMKYRGLEFVRAERAIGARHARIIWKVILPNALPPLIVSATLAVGAAILFEAGLSFLGLGDPNQMSWGLMIGSSRAVRAVVLVGAWPFRARDLPHRARGEPDRRRPQRRPQPEAARALMDDAAPLLEVDDLRVEFRRAAATRWC